MAKVFIGIDPGLKGGWAVISDPGDGILGNGKPANEACGFVATDGRVDGAYFAGMLTATASPIQDCLVILEKVHSLPKQGVASTFKFGVNYGIVLGVVASLGYRMELVTPQAWKKVILAGTQKDKDAAIAWAQRAYPNVSLIPPGCRKPSDGLADALAIAAYGQRTYG